MAAIDPAQVQRNNWVVWACLLASQVVYVAIAGPRVSGRAAPLPAVFATVLAAVAAATGLGAHFLWRRARGAGLAAHEPPPTPQVRFTSFLLAWVLDESIGVCGLTLSFLGAPLATWAPFNAAAIALLLIHRPA